jgi:hypothetical protein
MAHDRTTKDALELAQLVKDVIDAKRELGVRTENSGVCMRDLEPLCAAIDRLEVFQKPT